MSNNSSLILESSLQVFFFDLLQNLNKKSSNPLSNEVIFYVSNVMDKFGSSDHYFEPVDGKLKEKILGIRLLESSHLPKEKQKLIIKDIGETALQICGYFPESLNKKIIDSKYYTDIGVIAYQRLNAFVPKAYDTPNFFSQLALNFNQITNLMSLVSEKHVADPEIIFVMNWPKKAI